MAKFGRMERPSHGRYGVLTMGQLSRVIHRLGFLLAIIGLAICLPHAPAAAAKKKPPAHHPAAAASWAPRFSAILVDADTGEVLHESEADRQSYPASLSK